MQLELARGEASSRSPRILALCFPDLSLQRALRVREVARAGSGARAPYAIERDGRVAACDPEARARGVRPGDALVQARAACSDLEVAPGDAAADVAELEALAEAMLALAPAVEVAPPDALLLDASGADLFAPAPAGEHLLSERALALAAGLGLHGRAAIASGRGPARALARYGRAADPVPPGATATALAPLPLSALTIDAALAERLTAVGLRSVGDLARLPGEALAHRFGPGGLAAWRLALGEDLTPLVPFTPRSLPQEGIELEAPVEAVEPLLFAVKRLCDRVAARLAGRGLGASRLALALRLHPAAGCVRSAAPGTRRGAERLEVALARPSSAAARWLLVLRERLAELQLPAPVVGATLAVEEASPSPREQLALGDRPQQIAALEAVMARLAARLGEGALFAATPVDRHRPEVAFRAAAFTGMKGPAPMDDGARAKRSKRKATRARGASSSTAPAPLEPAQSRDCTTGRDERGQWSPAPLEPAQSRDCTTGHDERGQWSPAPLEPAQSRDCTTGRDERGQWSPAPLEPSHRERASIEALHADREAASPPASDLERPTRLLPRPEQLVALGEGGRLSAVRLGGRALRVLALSPVERLAGEWWAEPFERQYHRARLEGLGECWIYRDADGRLWLHGFFD